MGLAIDGEVEEGNNEKREPVEWEPVEREPVEREDTLNPGESTGGQGGVLKSGMEGKE